MKIPIKAYTVLLASYLRPQWRRAIVFAALLFASIGLQLVGPQILRAFIDTASAGGTFDQLLGVAALFLAAAVAEQIFAVLTTYFGQLVSYTAINRMRADLLLHCLRLDMSFHNKRTPGEMIQRIDGDVSALANFFSNFVLLVVGNALLLIGILALLGREDWRLGLALTVFASIALVAFNQTRLIAAPHFKALRQANGEYFGFLEERLGGTEDIRANGAVAYVLHGHARLMRELYRKTRKVSLMIGLTVNTYLALFILGMTITLGVSKYLFDQHLMTLGGAYLAFAYMSAIVIPLRRLSDQLQDLQQVSASISRIQELFNTTSRIRDGAGERLEARALAVEFNRVSFGYGESDDVIHDLSFSLEPGRVLGVLGRTGSGKTTLTRLLFRLYDPNVGTIRVGGVELGQSSVSQLRQYVGLVTQDVQLFHASVRDNLTFFDSGIADERIVSVLDELGLGEWYRALPRGLDTILGASGSGLSAGQAQLLAFARVFLREPGLVILDEASSRLDPATEQLIERAVSRLLTRRTGIIIAHRLSTVQRADEILILENGRVVEWGERVRLASDSHSQFYRLLQTGLQEVLA